MSYTTGAQRSQGPPAGRARSIPQSQAAGGQSRQPGGGMMATSPHMFPQAATMFMSPGGPQHMPPYPAAQMNYPSPVYIVQTPNPASNNSQVYYPPQIVQNTQLAGPSQQQPPGRPPSNPGLLPANANIIQQQTAANNFGNGSIAALQQQSQQYTIMRQAAQQPMTMQPPAAAPNQPHMYSQQKQPQQRKKNPLKIVDPNTKAVVNEEALATSSTNTPNSSNRSTPTATSHPPASATTVPNVHPPAQPQEAAHVDGTDIKCQFKAQVKASLSSSTASTTSEVSPHNLTNGNIEPVSEPSPPALPDAHVQAASEEKISAQQCQVVDTAATQDDEKGVSDSVELPPPSADSGVTVEPIAPVDAPVEPLAPVDVPVEPLAPVDVPVEPPAPVDVPVEPPAPVDVPVESPAPVDVPVESPAPVDVPVESSAPADVPVEPPAPADIPVESPAPVDVPVESPAPVDVPVEPLAPVDVPVESEVPLATDYPCKAEENAALEEKATLPTVDSVEVPSEPTTLTTETANSSEVDMHATEKVQDVADKLTKDDSTPPSDTEQRVSTEPAAPVVHSKPVQEEATPTKELETKQVPEPVVPAEIPTEVKCAPVETKTIIVSEIPTEITKSPSDAELMPPPATPGSTSPSTPVAVVPDGKENTPASTPPPLKGSKSMGADPAVMRKKSAGVTPEEMEGKTKTYSREFLMSLQNSALSKTKPDALGSSSILQEIMSIARGPITSGARRDFNPDYFKPTSSPRTSMHKRASVSRDKNMGPNPSMTRAQAPVITYKREEVKLSKAANAWKPGDVGTNVPEEEKEHLALLKSFRGILNKITPSNFTNLLKKILALPVKTEKDLQEVMILVFDKARNEPDFCRIYATLCQNIAKEFKAQMESTGSEVNFRKLLLVRCQHEFEKLAEDDSAMAKKAEQVKEAKSPEEATKLEEELKAFQTKARHRKLGYMRFIGELFLLQMLTPKIMHECIINLLKAADEESLEYLCRLWTTIGRVFDIGAQAKAYNDQFFSQMKKIANGQSRNVSLRIRFALQDVIELRENNWVPRRDKNVPKTLEEIHAQVAMEAQATQAMLDKPMPTRNSQGRAPPAPRSRRDDQDGAGWSHVKTGSQRVDPTKLKLTKQSILGGDGEVQLGPAKGFGGSWGRGSSGSGKNTPPLQPEERQTAPSNRFSALSGGADKDHRDERSASGNRMPMARGSGSMGRGMNRNVSNRMGTPRGSMEKDRQRNDALSAVRQISRGSSSRGPSRENSVEGRNLRTPTPTRNQATSSRSGSSQAGAAKQLPKEEFETKIKSIVDEYLHNNDVKEVLEIVREEMAHQLNKEVITECTINHVIERSNQARKGAGQMLAELLKHKLLPLDAHLRGLGAVLEFADDLAIDIPNVWEYFGQLIAPMFTIAAVPLSQLRAVCSPLLGVGKAATVAAHILKESSHHMGHVELGKRWSESKLSWSMFLSADEDESSFIELHKLQYTLETNLSAESAGSHNKCDDAPAVLEKMLKEEPNETVFDWIDSNLSEECHQTAFIRSLSSAVAQSCLDAKGDFQEAKFKGRAPLLLRYYDSKQEREVAALFAFEELMDKLQHPADLFTDLCYQLSENDLIADESFYHWEKNSKNGVAVKSVGKFFAWLKNDD